MYSKYEEMCVMRNVLNSYVNAQKQGYDKHARELNQIVTQRMPNIADKSHQEDLQRQINLMGYYSNDFAKGVSVLGELGKAIACYEQAYTQENVQSGLVDERAKQGNGIFFELRTKNEDYKSIMSGIAMELWRSADTNMEGLDLDLDTKLESLDKAFESGAISKEQLMYYTNMCTTLMITPEYVEYMQQFQQAAPTQDEMKR